jgi:hypothetical protein
MPGWHLVSVPGVASDMRVGSLISNAVGGVAYGYDGRGYVVSEEFGSYSGYWVYTSTALSSVVEVETVGRYRYRLSPGWNMIGGLDQVLGIDRMKVRPSGSVYSGVYGYDSQRGCYVQVEELLPGRGYWIEARSSCELIVNPRGRGLSKGLSGFTGARASGHKPPALPGFVGNSKELSSVPDEFRLKQNYPNPFNPETVIEYALPDGMDVVVCVYNVRGELIREIYRGYRNRGWHRDIWDGRNDAGSVVSSGVYLIEVTAGDKREVIKAMFLK